MARLIIGGGGGGAYSYIRVYRPQKQSISKKLIMLNTNMGPPPPPPPPNHRCSYATAQRFVHVERSSPSTCFDKITLCLQNFNGDEFLKCLIELIKIDKDWVPKEDSCSLYIRPTFIGTGVSLSSSLKLFI